MSDTTRKRCRKSKLVPRECAMFEEAEIHVQPPVKKLFIPVHRNETFTKLKTPPIKLVKECDKSVLKKINAAVRQDSEDTRPIEESARKFEVDIQIETCDEDISPANKLEGNKTMLRNHINNLEVTPFPSLELDVEDILKATEDIMKTTTNTADKSLGLYIRNSIGHLMNNMNRLSYHEEAIQLALEAWEACCEKCGIGDEGVCKCPICLVRFQELVDLNEHLVLCHSVRSDEPAVIGAIECKCSERYVSKLHHVCEDRTPVHQCLNCCESFYTKKLMRSHMEMSDRSYTCDICNENLDKSCTKYIHMMKHTDQFMLVAKCMQCPGFKLFVSEEDALQHKHSQHFMDAKKKMLFPKIIVPISCIVDKLKPDLSNVIKQEKMDEDDSLEYKEAPEIDVKIEHDFVKEEPVDQDENEEEDEYNLVIKEEPIEINETQIYTETYANATSVKEENLDEEDYEGDIIKINFNFESNDEFGIKENIISKNQTQNICDDSDNDTPDPVLVGGRMKNRIYKCNKCGYQARHKKFKEHVESDCGNSTYNKKYYNCTQCDTMFPSLGKYLMHFTKHGFQEMACPECLRQFQTHTQMGQHVHTHIKQNFVRVKLISHESYAKSDFQCKQCSEIVTVDLFFDHWQTHLSHNPDGRVRSIEEIRKDVNPDRIAHEPLPGCLSDAVIKECLQHIMMKVPKECNYCHRKFSRVYGCKRHIIEHLLADAYAQKPVYGALRCQMCATGFPTPEKYKQHMRDHASLPVYKCELCDRTFSDSSNFTKHKKVHNYKVLVCDLCGKKFQAKASLIKHLVKHEVSAPIPCNLCDKTFYFESSYRRHVRYSHDKATFGFRCVICNERFDSLKYKWDHMWQVHKERKQKADCPICLESFRKYADVKFHAKTVHGMDVSVLSMKNASNGTMNLEQYFKSPRIRVGENETLVVYESE
ncbi:hypothetical protein SFRURICE_014299 [Spodoptera frugiperda]|nr:hypothetical protein SFRURICE_014299 [Spodoptera frugiperda]